MQHLNFKNIIYDVVKKIKTAQHKRITHLTPLFPKSDQNRYKHHILVLGIEFGGIIEMKNESLSLYL